MTATRVTRWQRRAPTAMPRWRPTRAPRWRWRRPAAVRAPQTWVAARLRARDGTPVAGRWVAINDAKVGDVWTVTDDAGGVRVFGVPAGSVALRVPESLLRSEDPAGRVPSPAAEDRR